MNLDELSERLEWVRSRHAKIQPGLADESRNPRFMWEEAAETLAATVEELQVAEEELRQQAEELEQSRAVIDEQRRRYRDLFDFAPAAYLVTDPAGIIREANRAAGHLLNVEPRYLTGKPMANFVAMEDRPSFRQSVSRLDRAEPSHEWRYRLVPRLEGPFDATLQVAASRDWTGQVEALLWAIRRDAWAARLGGDGAPARQAEGSGSDETRALRALLDGLAAVVWEADAETGAYRFVGRGIEDLLGFPAERWMAEPGLWAERLHADDRIVASAWRGRCFAEAEPGEFEYRLMSADGRVVWVREAIAVGRDEATEARVLRGFLWDIGRRKKAERRLYTARHELAERLADAAYLDELTGRLSGPPEPAGVAEEILGAVISTLGAEMGVVRLRDPDRGELETIASVGLGPEWLAQFGRLRVGEDACGLAVASGGPVVVEDIEAGPDERSRESARAGGYRAAFSVPLLGRDGGLIGTVAAFFPAPHRSAPRQVGVVERYARRAADALAQARRHHELLELERRKDEALAMLAHELRTPLAAIHNSAQVLRPGAIDKAGLDEAREVLVRHARAMARMVEDLLDASRVARGSLALRPERVAAAEVVARAVEDVRPQVEAKRHDLAVSIPSEPILLEADPTRLEQVLVNLLANAAKFTPEGGQITLMARLEGGELVVRVADSGVGLKAEDRARIFDLFAQAGAAADRRHGGLGIGLALVKSLVEMHGGSVSVASDGPGQGSEFVVRLPVASGQPATAREVRAINGKPSAMSARRLLVVDDEPDSARALARLLRFWGHEVEVAHDVRSALEGARRTRPEVVFLDLSMPGADGFEVARRLREFAGEGLRLVALTGHARDEDRRRTEAAGFAGHLVKPVDPSELVRLLGIEAT
jgi:PAS domain S-box-containing protein